MSCLICSTTPRRFLSYSNLSCKRYHICSISHGIFLKPSIWDAVWIWNWIFSWVWKRRLISGWRWWDSRFTLFSFGWIRVLFGRREDSCRWTFRDSWWRCRPRHVSFELNLRSLWVFYVVLRFVIFWRSIFTFWCRLWGACSRCCGWDVNSFSSRLCWPSPWCSHPLLRIFRTWSSLWRCP